MRKVFFTLGLLAIIMACAPERMQESVVPANSTGIKFDGITTTPEQFWRPISLVDVGPFASSLNDTTSRCYELRTTNGGRWICFGDGIVWSRYVMEYPWFASMLVRYEQDGCIWTARVLLNKECSDCPLQEQIFDQLEVCP